MEHTKGSLVQSRMLALSTDAQVTAPCGCELFRSRSDGKSVTFRYCDTHAAAPELLQVLEALSPNIKGRDANGEGYWHPIHVHPLHSFTAECPWCQRVAAIKAAKGDA